MKNQEQEFPKTLIQLQNLADELPNYGQSELLDIFQTD